MFSRKILLDNAYASWQTAIKYCDAILSGRATLLNRKCFVSNLQNAVELFIKQIMLDNIDYRVSEIKNCEINGTPARDYYASTDLNIYFENLSEKQLRKFYSINFRKLIDIHKEILKDYLKSNKKSKTYKTQLDLLSKLRNDETHFYIKSEQFLLESDFVCLYNFMIEFYNVICFYELLPYWGEPPSEYKHLEFNRKTIEGFSYIEAAKNSKLVKELSRVANVWIDGIYPGETAYCITDAIISCSETDFSNQFNEAWEYLQVLDQYGLIEIETVENEVDVYDLENHCETTEIKQNFLININI